MKTEAAIKALQALVPEYKKQSVEGKHLQTRVHAEGCAIWISETVAYLEKLEKTRPDPKAATDSEREDWQKNMTREIDRTCWFLKFHNEPHFSCGHPAWKEQLESGRYGNYRAGKRGEADFVELP